MLPDSIIESLILLAIVFLTVVLLAVVLLAIVLLAIVLLTIVTIVVDDDGWWRCSAQNDSSELGRSNGLLSKKLSLQVEQGSGSQKGGILLNEGNITNEQVLVGQDDGSRVREELGARWRLRGGRVEGQQDSAVGSLSEGSSRVELRNLGRGSWLRDGLACARDTGNVQVGWRGLRLDSESTVGSHHHKNLARIVAVISLKCTISSESSPIFKTGIIYPDLVDHVPIVDIGGIPSINNIGDGDDDSIHSVPPRLEVVNPDVVLDSLDRVDECQL